MKSKKKELTSYILKIYENMNTSEFNGYSIAYARRKGIQGKGKHRIRRGFME